jgi:DNA recombination protein RmuC
MEFALAFILSGFITGMGLFIWFSHKQKTLKSEFDIEREKRIIAEQTNSRITELQEAIAHKEKNVVELQNELSSFKSKVSELEGRLSEKQQAYDEKTVLLKDKDVKIAQLQSLETELKTQTQELSTKMEEQQKAFAEKERILKETEERLKTEFKSLSHDVLNMNNKQFLELAKTQLSDYQNQAKGDLEKRQKAFQELVNPLKETLQNVDKKIGEFDKQWIESYSKLTEKMNSLLNSETELKRETSNLVTALRKPHVRGRWGEIQLRRVVEIAGMVNYCDFKEQETAVGDGRALRPDMVVSLPNDRTIVVDSKAPLTAYIDSLEMKDTEHREAKLREHADQVKDHIAKLGTKGYWEQFEQAPEFVVMFLPGEMFFSAALEQEPSLIEIGVKKKVILATPTTLIALLQAVAYGWKQEQVAKNAFQICELGKQLYDRLRVMAEHLSDTGKGLAKAMEYYNKTVGTFESRVLISARRFKELKATNEQDIATLTSVDTVPRKLEIDTLE